MNIVEKIASLIIDIIFPKSHELEHISALRYEGMYRGASKISFSGSEHIVCLSYRDDLVKSLLSGIKTYRDSVCIDIAGQIMSTVFYRYIKEVRGLAIDSKTQVVAVPIPLSRTRKNERGYNQCELLATAFGHHMRMMYGIQVIVQKDILRKKFKPFSGLQKLKNRTERLESKKDAFKARIRKADFPLEDAKIKYVIVDDVLTTGSTLSGARNALRTALDQAQSEIYTIAVAH